MSGTLSHYRCTRGLKLSSWSYMFQNSQLSVDNWIKTKKNEKRIMTFQIIIYKWKTFVNFYHVYTMHKFI